MLVAPTIRQRVVRLMLAERILETEHAIDARKRYVRTARVTRAGQACLLAAKIARHFTGPFSRCRKTFLPWRSSGLCAIA